MNIDTGLAAVIIAVLVFYLRLIILQRQRAKQIRKTKEAQANLKKGKKAVQAPAPPPQYTILSSKRLDWVIAGLGIAGILAGVLLYTQVLPIDVLQTYWWIPTSLGIVAFSWAFKL